MGFLRAVADDKTVSLSARGGAADPASLLHGTEHVDRLVDGEDALGIAVADRPLATTEVDANPAEGEGSLVARVPVEAVHHLPGVDLGALGVNRHRAAVVFYYERRVLHVLGDYLRAPLSADIVVVIVVVGPEVLSRNRG